MMTLVVNFSHILSKNKFNTSLLLVLYLIGMSSCKKEQIPIRITGEAQGTYYSIVYFDSQNRDLREEIDSLFKAFDMSASVYKKESVISKVNRNELVKIDSVFLAVFEKAMEVSVRTNGAFDITVMPLVNAWGFGYDSSGRADSTLIDSLIQLVGFSKIRIQEDAIIKDDPRIMIDFNAIAQGFTCDVIGAYFQKHGISNYLIDVGGEVLAKGQKPDGKSWIVAVEKPADSSNSEREIQIAINLKDKALATSGNYRAYFVKDGKRYSHTINPSTGFPVNHSVLSVSVIADQCMTADAFATAFMVMGLEKTIAFLKENKDLEAYVIYDDTGTYKVWQSDGFPQAE